ncbi:GDP-L-fucose synthase family protein [Nisaea sp.]|uniref:GDP-L-fucose synthase family protein n=1 Tax=Nisaea sp. TaxID=2024842 RepID=UPI003B51DD07
MSSEQKNGAGSDRQTSIWVCGHNGFVGSALSEKLRGSGYRLLTVDRNDLDLRRQADVEAWLAANRPDIVIMAAATVGGIQANRTRPAEFIYDNLAIAVSTIEAARKTNCSKLVYLGASCIYPRDAEQPIVEDCLLTGELEPTNEGYAIAKIAGLKLCEFYRQQYGMDCITVIPANLYGPGQHTDLENSHVCGALMSKIHTAKQTGAESVEIWGSGRPTREFLYIDDFTDGMMFALQNYSDGAPLNLGAGSEVSIAALAAEIAAVVGYEGRFVFDHSKPDGMMRKSLDGGRIHAMGWTPKVSLRSGLERTYQWYVDQLASRA